jgi:hypothetical protein
MATDCILQLTLKFQQKMKPVVARFDAEHASTDGGALLLEALDERLALTEDLAACLPDRRDPRKVQHATPGLYRTVAQREPTGDVCRESPAQCRRRPP